MSSIIACSSPPFAGVDALDLAAGVLASSVRPSAWASRRAGSMVSTTVRRPCTSAARSAERGRGGGLADPAGAAAHDDPDGGIGQHRVDVQRGHALRVSRALDAADPPPSERIAPVSAAVDAGSAQSASRSSAGPVDAAGQERQLDHRAPELGQVGAQGPPRRRWRTR